MNWITDLHGERIAVYNVTSCIEQVEVIVNEDLNLKAEERNYWKALLKQLHEISG